MTFSLVARCAETGMFGTAVSSSSPAVAARCSHTRANIGAVSSQNITDPSLGPRTLDLIEKGLSASEAIKEIQKRTNYLEYRQILVIDSKGETSHHSGSNSLGVWSDASGLDVLSAGNLLANKSVPDAIVSNFESSKGHLGDRLISALMAGLQEGGEAGPVHSAGIQISDTVSWPLVDLRCDWSDGCPIETISDAWKIYKPQMDAYVQRALNPSMAPSYGVPGDL